MRLYLPERVAARMDGRDGIYTQFDALRFEAWLHALRHYLPWAWRPGITLSGEQRIKDALAGGRGAVLWISQFGPHYVVQKVALHRAGFEVHQLYRPDHPFSKTRFGKSKLNRIITRVEGLFLAGQLFMRLEESDAPDRTLRAMRRLLAENRVISITVAETAVRLVRVPFFEAELELPTGPANLALAAGAPLIPIFTVRTGPGSYEVRVEEPLCLAGPGEREERIRQALAAYAALLQTYVEAYPLQWVGPLSLVHSSLVQEPMLQGAGHASTAH
jgi:lauroyl/myristoyl acyltransferase